MKKLDFSTAKAAITLCHVTCKSKEMCSTGRSIGVWYQSTARESIRRGLHSYSSRSALLTHSDRSKQRCFKSNTSKQSSEEASSCFQVRGLPSKT